MDPYVPTDDYTEVLLELRSLALSRLRESLSCPRSNRKLDRYRLNLLECLERLDRMLHGHRP